MPSSSPGERYSWEAELADRRAPHRVESDHRLVLLGTSGGSNPKATRCGFANAVVIGERAYLVDGGEGVHRQLWRAGLTASARLAPTRPLIDTMFVTHLHADHVMDLPNIFQGSWPLNRVDVYGPGPAGAPFTTHDDPVHPVRFPEDPAPGLRRMLDHFDRAFAMNINARIIAEGRADYVDQVQVHEIGPGCDIDTDAFAVGDRSATGFEVPAMEPFVVMPRDANGVTVTAVLVQHAPAFPALAYRFETPHGSVVFSGDTGPCDNVVRLAAGADLLVHEVIDLDAMLSNFRHLQNYDEVERQLSRSHTSVADVGAIAERAGVGTLILSHIVPGEGSHSPAEWEALAQVGFSGRVVCGVDLDEFALGSA